jgi:hypothetical protein
MKKIMILFMGIVLLNACSSKDEKFCECLKASEAFESVNRKVLAGKRDDRTLKEAISLKKEKEKVCEDYLYMDGQTMLEKKKDCGSL